jgi:hypothetical protein
MKFIGTLIAILAFINLVAGYLTQNCVATSRSRYNPNSHSPMMACDNDFGSAFKGGACTNG